MACKDRGMKNSRSESHTQMGKARPGRPKISITPKKPKTTHYVKGK